MAFQIGYQPLMRCHHQSGYVYPLRYGIPLNEDRRFERMRFKQSVELSQRVFKMMDGGKKVFPQEGITEIRDILIQIQNTKRFSYDQDRHYPIHTNDPHHSYDENAILNFHQG